jgi:adenylate cyclase
MISFVTPLTNIARYNAVAKHAGYFNSSLDADGYIRRINLLAMAKSKPFPALPLEMARVGLGEKLQLTLDERQHVKSLGFFQSKTDIPVTPLGVMQINFRGPSAVFTHISANDLMNEKEVLGETGDRRTSGKTKAEILKDAYVLIGVTALGVFDMRQFPFEANAPGVYGHANILDNLLSQDPLIMGSSKMAILLLSLVMLVGVCIFAMVIERLDAIPALTLVLATFLTLGWIDFKVIFQMNINLNTVFTYLEVITVFILTLAAKYVLEEKNKKFIRSAFAKYVPPAVVDSILKDPAKLSLGGEKREMTILFSDIRGFTTFSEKMDAKALASFLNDYLGIMTGLVFSNQGTLDKYIGDAVMAFWGAPLSQAEHASNACAAAIQMQQALSKNYDRFKSQYGIDVQIGVGINSGVVNVGNMGSEQNFEYTVIGDHVNLASRLEGLTKKYGVKILTSRYTFDCIRGPNPLNFPHRILDSVRVKGKKQAIELIQILDREYPQEALQLFDQGRKHYQELAWADAIEKFKKADALISKAIGESDGPCQVYMERCTDFQSQPPTSQWDGSWEMDSK